MLVPVDELQDQKREQRQRDAYRDYEWQMRDQKPESLMSVMFAQIRKRKVANHSCRKDNRNEIRPAHLQRTCTKNRNFHWHGKRRQRRQEHSYQAVTLKPCVQTGATAARDVLCQQNLAAFSGNRKQEQATGKRSENGTNRGNVSLSGISRSNRDEQSVNPCNHWNASGVKGRKQQKPVRTPRDQNLYKVLQVPLRALSSGFSIAKRPASSSTGTLRPRALSSFEPASSPAIT